jgi:hypothetical protein
MVFSALFYIFKINTVFNEKDSFDYGAAIFKL